MSSYPELEGKVAVVMGGSRGIGLATVERLARNGMSVGIVARGVEAVEDAVAAIRQANLRRYAERMGWTDVPWYTIRTERFSADFGVDEWFGFNVFLRDGDDVYRTYFLQHGAMVQWIGSLWSLWSLTPYGGQSDGEDAPEGWPTAPDSFWFRRHDEFDEPPPSAISDGAQPN